MGKWFVDVTCEKTCFWGWILILITLLQNILSVDLIFTRNESLCIIMLQEKGLSYIKAANYLEGFHMKQFPIKHFLQSCNEDTSKIFGEGR